MVIRKRLIRNEKQKTKEQRMRTREEEWRAVETAAQIHIRCIVQMRKECVKVGYMRAHHTITAQTHNRIYYHNIIKLLCMGSMRERAVGLCEQPSSPPMFNRIALHIAHCKTWTFNEMLTIRVHLIGWMKTIAYYNNVTCFRLFIRNYRLICEWLFEKATKRRCLLMPLI